MPTVTKKQIQHGAALLKQLVKRVDLNNDGAIRAGDLK